MTRITSRLYIFFGLVVAIFMVIFPFAVLSNVETTWIYAVALGAEPLMAVALWYFLNMIDIYQGADDRLYCYTIIGKQLNIPPTRKFGKLRLWVQGRFVEQYSGGTIIWRDDAGRRRFKFFIVRDSKWDVLQQLPMD